MGGCRRFQSITKFYLQTEIILAGIEVAVIIVLTLLRETSNLIIG